MQDDSYADAEEEGKRREHEMKEEKGREVEEKESRKAVEEKERQGDGGDLVEERKEEGGLKSIEAIAIKLVSSAEQGRRGSREEPLEKEEEKEEMEEEDVGTDAKTDIDGNTNENVFRCSNAILKALPPASEPVLLSAGCNPGRKSV